MQQSIFITSASANQSLFYKLNSILFFQLNLIIKIRKPKSKLQNVKTKLTNDNEDLIIPKKIKNCSQPRLVKLQRKTKQTHLIPEKNLKHQSIDGFGHSVGRVVGRLFLQPMLLLLKGLPLQLTPFVDRGNAND